MNGALVGYNDRRKTEVFGKKPVPVPFCTRKTEVFGKKPVPVPFCTRKTEVLGNKPVPVPFCTQKTEVFGKEPVPVPFCTRKTKAPGKKPVPVPFCTPQISGGLVWRRIGSPRCISARTMSRPSSVDYNRNIIRRMTYSMIVMCFPIVWQTLKDHDHAWSEAPYKNVD